VQSEQIFYAFALSIPSQLCAQVGPKVIFVLARAQQEEKHAEIGKSCISSGLGTAIAVEGKGVDVVCLAVLVLPRSR